MVGHALFLALETVALVGAALLVLYPFLRYASNVAHSTAVIALSGSLILLTAAAVLQTTPLELVIVENGLFVASTVAFLASQWLFAREFVIGHGEDRTLEDVEELFREGAGADAAEGGFERAERD